MIHTEECSLGSAILLLLVITLVEFKISDFTRFLGDEVHAVSGICCDSFLPVWLAVSFTFKSVF